MLRAAGSSTPCIPEEQHSDFLGLSLIAPSRSSRHTDLLAASRPQTLLSPPGTCSRNSLEVPFHTQGCHFSTVAPHSQGTKYASISVTTVPTRTTWGSEASLPAQLSTLPPGNETRHLPSSMPLILVVLKVRSLLSLKLRQLFPDPGQPPVEQKGTEVSSRNKALGQERSATSSPSPLSGDSRSQTSPGQGTSCGKVSHFIPWGDVTWLSLPGHLSKSLHQLLLCPLKTTDSYQLDDRGRVTGPRGQCPEAHPQLGAAKATMCLPGRPAST